MLLGATLMVLWVDQGHDSLPHIYVLIHGHICLPLGIDLPDFLACFLHDFVKDPGLVIIIHIKQDILIRGSGLDRASSAWHQTLLWESTIHLRLCLTLIGILHSLWWLYVTIWVDCSFNVSSGHGLLIRWDILVSILVISYHSGTTDHLGLVGCTIAASRGQAWSTLWWLLWIFRDNIIIHKRLLLIIVINITCQEAGIVVKQGLFSDRIQGP